ncbi:hypothetical protein C8J56DRAFT_939941, partial [Mycena floridula]
MLAAAAFHCFFLCLIASIGYAGCLMVPDSDFGSFNSSSVCCYLAASSLLTTNGSSLASAGFFFGSTLIPRHDYNLKCIESRLLRNSCPQGVELP